MTENQYKEAIHQVQRVDPGSGLLCLAMRGYTPVNCSYLQKAIDSLPVDESVEKPVVIDSLQSRYHVYIEPDDPDMLQIQQTKSKLFVERAKLSNSFHDCATVTDRAAVSVLISRVQQDIFRIMEKEEYFWKHGKPSLTVEADEYPSDRTELTKMLLNVRSSLSRSRRKLKQLSKDPTGNAARIAKTEEAIMHYERKKEDIEQRLTTAGV